MTNTTYEIEVIHRGHSERQTELAQAVAAELSRIGLHRTVAVAVGDAPPTGDSPSVAVYLGSAEAARDPGTIARVDAALGRGQAVIPVVDDLDSYNSAVPQRLRPINGCQWSGANPAVRLAQFLLAELGVEERQRRVFISHKRDDGLGAAEQLHDELSHMGFTPFIDRFSIRQGAAVQDAIADALENHAFLLLLETPLAASSDWVFDEVDYALSHTMGALILQWPDDPSPVPGSEGLPRLSLSDADRTTDAHGYDILTAGALDRVVAAVESAHAYGLVRRRKMLVRSIEDAAEAAGRDSVPLPDWRLLVEGGDEVTLLGITPRLPTAQDLQVLDQARAQIVPGDQAILVHSARVLREQLREHLVWVAGERDLVVMPEHAIGGRWTRV